MKKIYEDDAVIVTQQDDLTYLYYVSIMKQIVSLKRHQDL